MEDLLTTSTTRPQADNYFELPGRSP